MSDSKTFSLTFGDVAENHKGMQKIGTLSNVGFNLSDINKIKEWFEAKGCKCNIINLHSLLDENLQNENQAYLLTVKNAVNALLDDENGKDSLFKEQDELEKDTKAFMYGRVVNKHARHNLCFSDFSQEPDYENKKGRVIDFKDDRIKLTNEIRNKMGEMGEEFKKLNAEGNYYYDIEKTFIGAHGDSERRKVIGVRLGEEFPLYYHWYYKNEKVGELCSIEMRGGDVYIMSDKAVGNDWKCRNKYTLRHAAGYLKNIKEFK
jgi:hypothetical protein